MKSPIRCLRETKNLNRKQFSHKTGIPYATLSNLEAGLCNSMGEKTASTIAEFSGQDPETIIEEYELWRKGLKESV